MASAKIFRINYKSDFILTLESDAGWMTPFCIKFWTGAPSQAYYVGWDGETYNHCSFDPSEPTKLLVQFDDHHLPIGDLKYQVAYHFTVDDFPNDTEDEVINPASITTEIDGETYQVMLDFTGETAPEIQFALPAYANEAQRIANEQQRIAAETQRIDNEETRIANEQTRINQEQTRQQNEQQRINQEQARVNEYATLKADAVAATGAANDAAALANQKAQLAADKAALAQDAANLANAKAQLAADKAALAASAAQLANDKAALAQQKAEYAQTQGGYAKDQGDYAKDKGDICAADHLIAVADHGIAVDDHTQAGNDHTRAESDHGIAVDDHTQAGNDHTRAESDHGIAVNDHTQAGNDHTTAQSDHTIASNDHTQAGNDHTRAESDHTRAESDHAAVEVYVDSLGAFDISAYHATGGVLAKYADLTAALGTNGANIPDALRKGGMSVKFVQSSDHKYVQYRYMGTSTANANFTNVANWQGVDEEPKDRSHNIPESGGTFTAIKEAEIEMSMKVASIDINKFYSVKGYYITSNNLYALGNYTSAYIKVSPGDTVELLAYPNLSQYAFLKSFDYPVNGISPDYSSIIPNRQIVSVAITQLTVPSDTNYIWIIKGLISEIKINGVKIDALKDSIGRTTNVVFKTTGTLNSGHASTDGVIGSSSYHYTVLSLAGFAGKHITVENFKSQYGFARAYITNTRLLWCDGYTRQKGTINNVTIPSDALYLYLLCSAIPRIMVEGVYIDIDLIDVIVSVANEVSGLTEFKSKNIINPANVKYNRRYSADAGSIIAADSHNLVSSGLIEVEEGEWYVMSGQTVFQGGYFGTSATGAIGNTQISAVSFVNTVDNSGKCFQVPLNSNIKYVVVNLVTNSDRTALSGTPQIELGEVATEYSPYLPVKKIKEELLPSSGGGGGEIVQSDLSKYTTFGNLCYHGIGSKIPNFRQHFYAKDKDLCVVNTGTSLTARSSEHCTTLVDAPYRPPLLHSNNFASHIWNALCWEGQQYRRYDAENFFTESGTGWQTQSNIEDWDDGSYRAGLTRFTNDGGSVSFVVPIDAWQFNFIYRSDSAGSEACVISIAEGNGKMEVWNGSAWVEANGYTFSEREAAVTRLPSITVTNPSTGTQSTYTNYQVKGNTTYQKRLKMRCKSGDIDSRDATKTVTITSASGRLLYWGVEWSPRQYMITYINAARGSHTSLVNSTVSLCHYQDNEVWGFNPDLLLSEDPIHNAGGSGVPNAQRRAYYSDVSEQFWFAENGVSMKDRCSDLGLTEPEWALFNTTITWNFGGINKDGTLKIGAIANGLLMWSALDSQSSVYMYMLTNHPSIIYINAVKNWVEAGMACYHSMKAATVGSGKDGLTFTNEGSHWNDTGCKVMARVILPILDLFT